MLGALADAVDRAARGGQDLACAADDLAGDEERNEDVGEPAELTLPANQIVLVTSVGVAGRIGVVLEEVDVAGDALFAQPAFGVDQQTFEGALAGLVVHHQVDDVVAFGRRVFGMAPDVEVEACAVAEKDVAGSAPRDDPPKQVPSDLIGRQPPLAVERAGNAVLVLQAENPPVHAGQLKRGRAGYQREARAIGPIARPGICQPRATSASS